MIRVHDIGTGNGPSKLLGLAFDTPSSRGVWHTAPYLHDGRASTLQEALIVHNPTDHHGQTSHLSEQELQDLVAFLLSLEGDKSLVQNLGRVE